MEQQFSHAKKMGWTQATNVSEYSDEVSAKKSIRDTQAKQARREGIASTPQTQTPDATPARNVVAGGGGAGGAATATASVSGGSLMLEVQNWESVLAQSNYALEGARS